MVCGEADPGDFEPVNLWRLVIAVMFSGVADPSEVNRDHSIVWLIVLSRT
jgi:hypothetical protein